MLSVPYVDEAQDFSLEAPWLIRAISPVAEGAPDSLCAVGDRHQRIYRYKVPMSRAGIDIRGRSRRLKINYRTTQQIRNFAKELEFRAVAMACADPDDPMNYLDKAGAYGQCERYVAATRAREHLLVTVAK